MDYSSLEQRMAQSFLDLFPPFVPEENAPVSTEEQRDFYEMINRLYQLAFDEPLLFVTALHDDDAYPSRYKKAYGKPQLILDMKKFIKPVETLLQNMFLLGQGEAVKQNKREQAILARLGVVDVSRLPAAWVWMSTREGAHVTAFAYCLFRRGYSYAAAVYARLLGETAFQKLENWMLTKGYRRFDIYDVTASDCKLSLTIANPQWGEEPPRGGFEYKIRHTGLSAQLDFYVREPVVLGLCIPNGMKTYLEAFDTMPEGLRQFVATRTKKCDACGYCTQTDKTGMRPRAYVSIAHGGKNYNLCTYFPGGAYCWPRIDDSLVDELIQMLTFMDMFAPLR